MCVALFFVACGAPPPAPEPPAPEPEAPALEDPFAAPLPALREAAERAAREDVVAAAELARVLSIRDPEGGWIARAREWLSSPERDPATGAPCEVALALARLEARDAASPRAAYLVAFRASLRFAASAPECARAAAAMLPSLEPWRPSTAELAAIRADPEASAPLGAPEDPIARWAAEHSDEQAATLESLLVYGHEGGGGAAVRVVLRLDRIAAFEHGEAEASAATPRRTWLELASVTVGEGVARSLPVGSAGLRAVVVSEGASGTRVAFELDEGARFDTFVLPDPFRVVLDFEAGGARARGPVRRIVIDPGHGGDDFGARAFGMRESDLVLDVARRVRALLLARLPDVAVITTRDEDAFVSLEARTALANAVGADAFVSIHLNAADEPVARGGVTTFVLDITDDRQALRLAARENRSSLAEVSSLSRLLASLHREEQVAASRALADHVHRATLAAGRAHLPSLHDRGVRPALFHVLVGARMPAILVEASFLSREEEAAALRGSAYRQALADGIADGIVRWAAR